jgi:hypothetical protein
MKGRISAALCEKDCTNLRQQLLRAQAAIVEVEAHNIAGTISPEALARHDAEVRKPLVDAIHGTIDWLNHNADANTMASLIAPLDKALAKAKEGK